MYMSGDKRIKTLATSRYDKDGENNIVYTPNWLAKEMWDIANETWYKSPKTYSLPRLILEPCAGKGSLLKYIPPNLLEHTIAYEIDDKVFPILRSNYPTADTICKDFFLNDLDYVEIDIILINPPFSIRLSEAFIFACLKLLSTEGVMVAILPDWFLNNSELRKKRICNHIQSIKMLPKNTFDTDGDGKPNPLHTNLVVFRKKWWNNFFLFKTDYQSELF